MRTTLVRVTRASLLALLLAGCGSSSLKEAGEECVASSECAAGLVCDLGQSPSVCAGNVTADALVVDAPPDLTDAADIDGPDVPIDAAAIDARIIDGAVIDAAVIDAPPPIDAAPPIDAPTDASPDA